MLIILVNSKSTHGILTNSVLLSVGVGSNVNSVL